MREISFFMGKLTYGRGILRLSARS